MFKSLHTPNNSLRYFLLSFIVASIAAIFSPGQAYSQNTWSKKADYPAGATAKRISGVGFSIGEKGYFALGKGYNDLWEYTPSTNTWVQKASYPGGEREGAFAFTIGDKAYVGTGAYVNGTGAWVFSNDFYEYNPATNVWTQKANYPGGTAYAAGFAIGKKGYVGTGYSDWNTLKKDFYEYDPATDQWTRKADFGGGIRAYATGFGIGNAGYMGTGTSSVPTKNPTTDFWAYDPTANKWSRKTDFYFQADGSIVRKTTIGAISFVINNRGYVCGGYDGNGTADNFFAKYDPTIDKWTSYSLIGFNSGVTLPNNSRTYLSAFSIGTKAYVGSGNMNGTFLEYWAAATIVLNVKLNSPDNNGIVPNTGATQFSWAGSPTSSYKITIVEVKAGQTAENAIGTNTPIFEKDSLDVLSIQYPLPFVGGTKYAWKVTAKQAGIVTTGGESEIRTFTFALAGTSNNSKLKGLSLSYGTLSPAFSATTYAYNDTVTQEFVSVRPTLENSRATVKINGLVVATGTNSANIPLALGNNTITAAVTAADGVNVRTYTITVTRLKVSTPPNISYTGGGHTYAPGVAITPLMPANSGGVVPATIYGRVNIFAGSGYDMSRDFTGTFASFRAPRGVATDLAGNIYVSDNDDHVIRKITPEGVTTTLAGTAGSPGNVNGAGTTARFNYPTGLAVDTAGNVYVADRGNNQIKKVTPAGVVSTFAGSGSKGNTNGTATKSKFNSPSAVALDGSGNVYVADFGNRLIRKITPAGVVSTFAGSGTAGSTNGTGIAASFYTPADLATDAAGNVYVADFGNGLVRKITPAGEVSTLAGGGSTSTKDGQGTEAGFNKLSGIATDAAGNVYVSDSEDQRIRKINSAGYVTTLVRGGRFGDTDGVHPDAVFGSPYSLATDATGNLYVAVPYDHIVCKVITTGYAISPQLPAGLNFDNTTGIISGTPTAGSPFTTYTITANNIVGSSAATVTFAVTTPSNNSRLSALTISSGTLSPGFEVKTYAYRDTVTASSVTVRPTAENSHATIKVNGVAVATNTNSANIPLALGNNSIATVVTAADGSNSRTYTIIVTRVNIAPNIAYAGSPYSFKIGKAITALTPTNSGGAATTGYSISPALPAGLSFDSGTGTITGTPTTLSTATNYTVTAGNATGSGTTTINIDINNLSNNSRLAGLTISNGTLSPAFSATTYAYSTTVTASSVTVRPTAENSRATITVNGVTVATNTNSAAIPLAMGNNTISTVVTAEDGSNSRTYTITVTRVAPSLIAALPSNARTTPYVIKDKAQSPDELPGAELIVKQALSPNGDGRNDVLLVEGIENFPDNTLKVMNRDGKTIADIKGYDNAGRAFDGHATGSGKLQPAGTYFYKLAYKAADGSQKQKTGYFILKY